ncbi:MAG: N-acetylmuramoyl-L-alanine amidase [Rhodothermales bacterium]
MLMLHHPLEARLTSRPNRLLTRTGWLALAALVLFLLPLVAQAASPTEVSRVAIVERKDGKGYVIRIKTNQKPQFQILETELNEALEVRLMNTRIQRGFQRGEPHGPILDYAVHAEGPNLTFHFDLDATTPLRTAIYRDAATPDLLIGVTFLEPRPVEVEVPVANAPQAVREDARKRWTLDTIVIDAGHGGKDPGARHNGVSEKNVVLPVALKLGKYLEDLLGVRVVYTRTDDTFVPLHERGKIANREGGKLFISIHANAIPKGNAYGTETFFLGMHRTDTAREVMERENGVVNLEADQSHYEDFDENALIMYTLAQSAYMKKSEALAAAIENQFSTRVGRKSRGVKQAGFIVLYAASMPSVLVELGFLSNRKEARFLSSEQGQDYMASAIFRAIRDFKETYESELNVAATGQ